VAVSAQRRRRVLVAVVAALIAAGAFYLAIEYTNKAAPTTTTSGTGAAPPVSNATVVVASSAIPVGTQLSATNLKTADVPVDVLRVLTAAGGSDYPTVAALTQSPEYAATALVAGLPILSSEVTSSATAANPAVTGIPPVLPAGDVAISLPYSPGVSSGTGSGTGGYIQALNRVDILVNLSGSLYWAYRNVLVLAVGESSGAPPPTASASASASSSSAAAASSSAGLIMVELPAQDAAALADVENTTGATIQYLIVPSSAYPSSGASPVPASTAQPQTITGTSPNNFFGG
jgi:Flp pilus assembly protein CpaB